MSEISWKDLIFNCLNEEEMNLLRLFHEQFIQIAESSFIKDGDFNSYISIQIDKINDEINITHDTPEEADIRSILLLVRPIKLQNDNTNIRIEKILSILKRRSANDKTQLYIQTLMRNYKDRSGEPAFRLRGRFGEYNEMDIFDLWVNGYYFHKDSSKRDELNDLMEWPAMKQVVKNVLIRIIQDTCNWAEQIDSILVNTIFLEEA
jgi:hypothetical protein